MIQKTVEAFGRAILEEWVRRGFDIGNHSYSHSDINELSNERIEEEIVRGEATIGPLLRRAGRQVEFFRFPMNHTGDTREKHEAIAAFLSQRGYRLAVCTIENSDYLFEAAYVQMLASRDKQAARELIHAYLEYTATEIDYYAALNKQVFGYKPPQVMLLHDNRLNSEVIGQVLELFEKKQYRFVTLRPRRPTPPTARRTRGSPASAPCGAIAGRTL